MMVQVAIVIFTCWFVMNSILCLATISGIERTGV